MSKRARRRRDAERRGERERAADLEPDDDAARWLREHDPAPPPQAPKSARKSKLLHQWRRRSGGAG
ncbi:MAG: hypothetical protein ICV64_00675 [Thermoleophilia bacterium]|nr:hypothetical protein [Thermoleophilia bacterium]